MSDDTSFVFEGMRYASLTDYLHTAHPEMFDELGRTEEDEIREAIKVYTEAIAQRQAVADTIGVVDKSPLMVAVKLLDRLIAWGDIDTRDEVIGDPWQDTRDFFELPFIKVLRGKLTYCGDHWHCDPMLAAHDCKGPDRMQPCPSCKAKPRTITASLEALKALVRAMAWPFKSEPPRVREFNDSARAAFFAAEKILRQWSMLP